MLSRQQIDSYRCRRCGWEDFHPAETCPRCSSKTGHSAFSGAGRILTFTAIRYPPKGFENEAPYVVAMIAIEEGPRVIGRVSNAVDELKIGTAVALKSNKDGALEFGLAS